MAKTGWAVVYDGDVGAVERGAVVVAAAVAVHSLPGEATQGERFGLARDQGDGVERRLQTQYPGGGVSASDGQGALHHKGSGAAAGRGAHLRCGEPKVRSVCWREFLHAVSKLNAGREIKLNVGSLRCRPALSNALWHRAHQAV